jgi:hypothetical protein
MDESRKDSQKYTKAKTGPRTPSCFAPNEDIYEKQFSKSQFAKTSREIRAFVNAKE